MCEAVRGAVRSRLRRMLFLRSAGDLLLLEGKRFLGTILVSGFVLCAAVMMLALFENG